MPGETWRHPKSAGSQPHQPEGGRVQVFAQYRDLLFSIAYRMLGSAADAEDMLQETFIRWQQSTETEIRSAKAFLITIISRLCIQQLQSARAKREEYVGPWLPEPIYTGGGSDPGAALRVQESVSMAFLLLLEKLTPVERAAFLLREVFEYEYDELAAILGKSEANCRQIVLRARRHISEHRPRFDASPEQHKRLLEAFHSASSQGDMQGLLALLSNEVVLFSDGGGKASAALNPICGADHVARFLLGAIKKLVPPGVTTRLSQVNGQPTMIYFSPAGKPACVLTLDILDGRVQNIYVVTNPEKLANLVPSAGARTH